MIFLIEKAIAISLIFLNITGLLIMYDTFVLIKGEISLKPIKLAQVISAFLLFAF